MPWSSTPLKFLFHRQIYSGGNGNTPNVSKYQNYDNYNSAVLSSNHAAGYKQLIQFDKDPRKEVNLFSLDTGMNESPFSGHYFDMN